MGHLTVTIITSIRVFFSRHWLAVHTQEEAAGDKSKGENSHTEEDRESLYRDWRVKTGLSGTLLLVLLFLFFQSRFVPTSTVLRWLRAPEAPPILSLGYSWLRKLPNLKHDIRAFLVKLTLAWSVGSWCLLLVLIFTPWWPLWKLHLKKMAKDDQGLMIATGEELNEEEEKEEEEGQELDLGEDWPCGLLLLTVYGMGSWCGLLFAYMSIHRAVLFTVSWLSMKAYLAVVDAVLVGNSDTFWLSWPLGRVLPSGDGDTYGLTDCSGWCVGAEF